MSWRVLSEEVRVQERRRMGGSPKEENDGKNQKKQRVEQTKKQAWPFQQDVPLLDQGLQMFHGDSRIT